MSTFPRAIKGEDRRRLFISYRRSDSPTSAGRLASDLQRYFGREMVYFDKESNRLGQDYVNRIKGALSAARGVIVVIGPRWHGISEASGRSRLYNEDDWVRRELEYALVKHTELFPVLVGHAGAPQANELPPELADLARIQMRRLSDDDWSYDFGRIIEALRDSGIIPARNDEVDKPPLKTRVMKQRIYEREVQAPRRHCLGAVEGAANLLNYSDVQPNYEAAEVTFRVKWLRVATKIVDIENKSGWSRITIEFESPNATALMASSLVTYGIAWPALRSWERRFAVGFLDNVGRVLEKKGVADDSFSLPGMQPYLRWRSRV